MCEAMFLAMNVRALIFEEIVVVYFRVYNTYHAMIV